MLTLLWFTFDDRIATLWQTPWLGQVPLTAIIFCEIVIGYVLALAFAPRPSRG